MMEAARTDTYRKQSERAAHHLKQTLFYCRGAELHLEDGRTQAAPQKRSSEATVLIGCLDKYLDLSCSLSSNCKTTVIVISVILCSHSLENMSCGRQLQQLEAVQLWRRQTSSIPEMHLVNMVVL